MSETATSYPQRFEIVKQLQPILKTGDVLFRQSKTIALGFLPFSQMVGWLTKSQFSHASIVYVNDGQVFLVELDEVGTYQLRLTDWLDFCQGTNRHFAAYRIDSLTDEMRVPLKKEIENYLDLDPDYDPTYNTPNYCTGSVAYLLESVGANPFVPMMPSQALTKVQYFFFNIFNGLIKKTTGKGFGSSPYYFPGNDKIGMLASSGISKIYSYPIS